MCLLLFFLFLFKIYLFLYRIPCPIYLHPITYYLPPLQIMPLWKQRGFWTCREGEERIGCEQVCLCCSNPYVFHGMGRHFCSGWLGLTMMGPLKRIVNRRRKEKSCACCRVVSFSYSCRRNMRPQLLTQ